MRRFAAVSGSLLAVFVLAGLFASGASAHLDSAHATVTIEVDLKGEVRPTAPVVRAFLMDGSLRCQERAPAVDIVFVHE